MRQSTSDTRPFRTHKRSLHKRIARRQALRRGLVIGLVAVTAVGAGIFVLRPDRPLLPVETPGTTPWAKKHYGNPDAPRFRERNIVTIEFLGSTMFVHKKVQRHFFRLESIFEARAPEYAATVSAGVPDDWSYHNRTIRGEVSAKSMHAFGISIDINALANVMGTTGDMPAEVVEQWEREGGDWGGDWTRPDPMHFESHLTRAEIRSRYNPDGTPKAWYLEELVSG